MSLTWFDGLAFVAFLAVVIVVSIAASRREKDSADYFLAGRSLTWWLIGVSLIASNISTEHFVGMAGEGFGSVGLAIASYEWIAAVTLVLVAIALLPLFLRLGIYTMPEFLERRYGRAARALMAVYMLIAYAGVAIAAVLYSGAIGLKAIFGLPLVWGIWLIGLTAGAYTIYGGLKAVVWSDLIQGVGLLLGGALVSILAIQRLGGLDTFLAAGADRLHVGLPATDPKIPWTALLLGIWIPNLFYWGCNQFITQRTLGARSLADGQKGILLAAGIKLLIPFIIVFPGIAAFALFKDDISTPDEAYAVLIANVLPAGLRGLLFAALLGAVMSSLDSMLNSASTIFTMDLYRQHVNPRADGPTLVRVGRIATGVLVLAGCLVGPLPGRFSGVFEYIQMVWGFISPGVVAAFLVGFFLRRAPSSAAICAMVLGIPIYGMLLWLMPGTAFLNQMAITFCMLVLAMIAITLIAPLPEPVRFERANAVDLRPSRLVWPVGGAIILATLGLYVYWW